MRKCDPTIPESKATPCGMVRLWRRICGSYRGVRKTYAKYWKAYGGWTDIAVSPYLHAALFLTITLYPRLVARQTPWFDLVLAVIPSVLGFTLAGYAFLLGMGDDRFRDAIRGSGNDDSPSPFMAINATFVHFIVLQFFSLCYGMIAQALDSTEGLFAFLGVLLFFYSLAATLAAVMAVLRLADWYDRQPAEPRHPMARLTGRLGGYRGVQSKRRVGWRGRR